jgi:hypothetical protein
LFEIVVVITLQCLDYATMKVIRSFKPRSRPAILNFKL